MTDKGVILLVENDSELNNLNRVTFYPRGYTVLTATTIAGARSILRETEPDIILMESNLYDGDGLEFISELTSVTKASIIFLTCRVDGKDEVRALNMGAWDYIKKPCDRFLLLTRVELAMRHRSWGSP